MSAGQRTRREHSSREAGQSGMGKKRGKGVPSTATPKDRRLKANGGGKRTS